MAQPGECMGFVMEQHSEFSLEVASLSNGAPFGVLVVDDECSCDGLGRREPSCCDLLGMI